MKKMLKGFTLAEILITLAVIGVIAVTTLPSLNTKVSDSQVGPALMKAINTLENANSLAIKTNNVRRLDQLDAKYFNAVGDNLAYTSKSATVIKTSDRMIYSCNNTINTATNAPSRFAGSYYSVIVDINGEKAPNAQGKDQFTLWVDTKGSVIPYGGEFHKTYTGASDTTCSTACTGTTVTDAASCTGSIVDNNGKVTYKYNYVPANSQ